MNVKCYATLFMLTAGAVSAQDFGVLGPAGEGFALPDPAYRFSFPEDHGAHPAFRTEWWYVTAVLTGADGAEYGMQWTLFRNALAPTDSAGWDSPQIWMGHAAVTTVDAHYAAERFARGGIGQAGVEAAPFAAWIDEWRMEGPDLNTVNLTAQGADFSYDLDLASDRPFVAQGAQGYSVKAPGGQASHYYSQPFYEVSGQLVIEGREVAVTGEAWLDREWSSGLLTEAEEGWDWFALMLEDGARVMGARMRLAAGGGYTFATWIAPDGTPTPYEAGAFTATPLETSTVAGREIPTRWRLELPARGLDVEAAALNPQSWMDTAFAYWEGPTVITGTHRGRGYLEMTGYE